MAALGPTTNLSATTSILPQQDRSARSGCRRCCCSTWRNDGEGVPHPRRGDADHRRERDDGGGGAHARDGARRQSPAGGAHRLRGGRATARLPRRGEAPRRSGHGSAPGRRAVRARAAGRPRPPTTSCAPTRSRSGSSTRRRPGRSWRRWRIRSQRSPAPLSLAMLASLPTPNRISSTENCPRSDRQRT